jgi:hypothetical protein
MRIKIEFAIIAAKCRRIHRMPKPLPSVLQLTQALPDEKSPDLFDVSSCSQAQILNNEWYK